MPSPPNNPYKPTILLHERDLDFGEKNSEEEKADLRKANGVVSCAGLAFRISSEEIMWMM